MVYSVFMTNNDLLSFAVSLKACHFRNVLDRKIYGKHRRLQKAVFIEEGKNATSRSYNERHCHMLIEKPKHLTLKQYKKEFKQ